MKTLYSLFILVSMALFTSCSNTKNTSQGGSESLFAYAWTLAELGGQPVNLSNKPNMVFTAGKINQLAGSTGCNRITGTFETAANNFIKFLPLATTKMACLGENLEKQFLDVLSKANIFSVENGKLTLSNGAIVLARFNGAAIESQTPGNTNMAAKLNGIWELNYITGPRIAFDGLFPDKKPQLIFALPSTEAGGHTSCNSFSARFTLKGDKISFADPTSTLMACPGAGEATFLKALKTVTKYAVENGNTLVLMAGEIPVMRFVKK